MSGASEKAIVAAGRIAEAAATLNEGYLPPRDEYVPQMLAAAHDPVLGEEASVRLGDVLRFIDAEANDAAAWSETARTAFRIMRNGIEREHREGRL